MPVKAVFFDAGETLVHPHPSFPELLSTVLREEGHHVDADTIRERLSALAHLFTQPENRLWSTSPERSRRFWTQVYSSFMLDLGLGFPDSLGERLYAVFTDLSNYRLFDDVLPVLDELRVRGLVLGVISNFEQWLEHLLEHLDVTPYFQATVISGVEGVEKPDPRIFRLALERTGVAPEDAVYVGDSVEFDIEPAASIGMTAVLLDRRGRYPDAGQPKIASLDQLPALLDER